MAIHGSPECALNPLLDNADKLAMAWVLLLGGIIGVWALLTVLGGEREQRIQHLTAKVLESRRNSNSDHRIR
jgi:hypothetical protein